MILGVEEDFWVAKCDWFKENRDGLPFNERTLGNRWTAILQNFVMHGIQKVIAWNNKTMYCINYATIKSEQVKRSIKCDDCRPLSEFMWATCLLSSRLIIKKSIWKFALLVCCQQTQIKHLVTEGMSQKSFKKSSWKYPQEDKLVSWRNKRNYCEQKRKRSRNRLLVAEGITETLRRNIHKKIIEEIKKRTRRRSKDDPQDEGKYLNTLSGAVLKTANNGIRGKKPGKCTVVI